MATLMRERGRGLCTKVFNETDYPDKEVERLIRHELQAAEIRGHLEITVRYSRQGSGGASGWWRSYWYPDRGERCPQILIRIPRPGVTVGNYQPYERRGEAGKSFPREDWQEALVSVAAHEIEHHRQYEAGERTGHRGSGRRRSQVEVRCDLAAYRAWAAYRRKKGRAAA
jgi:hypothetical protein